MMRCHESNHVTIVSKISVECAICVFAGVFASSWIGTALVGLGEYIIRKLPLVKHIYNAAKQVSGAVSPDHETANSFRYVFSLDSMAIIVYLIN